MRSEAYFTGVGPEDRTGVKSPWGYLSGVKSLLLLFNWDLNPFAADESLRLALWVKINE
jgi:hypothetical protein